MSGYRMISADDHVQEPKDMWQQRVPAALRERAPKVVNVDGGDVWMLEGQVVMKMGMNVAAGKKSKNTSWKARPTRPSAPAPTTPTSG